MSDSRFLGLFEQRVAAELPEGFVVGRCESDGGIVQGALIHGVLRRVGEQHWSDDSGHVMTVTVEDFDLDALAKKFGAAERRAFVDGRKEDASDLLIAAHLVCILRGDFQDPTEDPEAGLLRLAG